MSKPRLSKDDPWQPGWVWLQRYKATRQTMTKKHPGKPKTWSSRGWNFWEHTWLLGAALRVEAHKTHTETKHKMNLMTNAPHEKCQRTPTINVAGWLNEMRTRREESLGDIPVGSWGLLVEGALSFAPQLLRTMEWLIARAGIDPASQKARDCHFFGRGHLEKLKFRGPEVIVFLCLFLAFLGTD